MLVEFYSHSERVAQRSDWTAEVRFKRGRSPPAEVMDLYQRFCDPDFDYFDQTGRSNFLYATARGVTVSSIRLTTVKPNEVGPLELWLGSNLPYEKADGPIAQVSRGVTLPGFERLGLYSANMARALISGIELGARNAVCCVTNGEPLDLLLQQFGFRVVGEKGEFLCQKDPFRTCHVTLLERTLRSQDLVYLANFCRGKLRLTS